MRRHLPSALCVAVLVLLSCGAANAAGPCLDDGGAFPANCTKELRIHNNTPGKIYVVLQAGKEGHEAHNCPVSEGGGDIWLQAAFGNKNNCYKITKDYHVYVNPEVGIPSGSFVSVKLPWWSRRTTGTPDSDRYIDWWRGGRVVIFDDKAALDDTYLKLKGQAQVPLTAGSPRPSCNSSLTGNKCDPQELRIYDVPPAAQIGQHTPFQLNEFTFASVNALKDGGELANMNQNYNVSNVDQLYLPIAIEPVRQPADVPYMGTTMSVTDFRNKLKKFVDPNDNDVLEWPVYNNPLVKDTNLKDPDRRKYPNAGIRVPSALAVFNFYMNPSFFRIGKDQLEPEMLPYNSNNPGNPPSRVDTMMNEWRECTKIGANCPDAEVYRKMDAIFVENYNAYLSKNCEVPDYLKPVSGTAPRQRPKLTTFLRYVHGWVPFNNACPGVPQLPTIEKSRATRDYINLQYNYEKRESEKRWFNPYTHLGHAPKAQGGLSANAYAFSIDDQSSFQSNGGGTLPGGLIIAVGGPKGLKNGQQMPPPIPDPVPRWDFQVDLGGSANDTVKWAKYGICRADANMAFPPKADNAFSIGIDPADRNINAANPCPITLEDSKGRKYIIAVKKATPPGEQNPPKPIWPKWDGDGPGGLLDSSVVGCPARSGFVAPAQWCNFAKEFAVPQGQTVRGIPGPKFTIIGRGPLQN